MRPRHLIPAALAAALLLASLASAASPVRKGHYRARTSNGISISLHVSPRARTVQATIVCPGGRKRERSPWIAVKKGHFVGAARLPGSSLAPAYAISGRFRTHAKVTGLLYNDLLCNSSEKRYTARLVR